MRTYTYRARNVAGRIVEGTVRADDTDDAHRQLEEDALIPVEIRLAAEKKRGAAIGFFSPKVKAQDIIVFTRQLSTVLRASMPISQALRVLKAQADNATLKNVLEDVGNSIAGGSRLSEALAEFPRIFPSHYINIVISGETGGSLVQSLTNMADWLERETEIKAEIKSALRYPILVIVALLIAAILMLTFVVPRFAGFFETSTVALPMPTRILMAGNDLVRHYWMAVVGVIVGVGAAIFFLLKKPLIRLQFDKLKFRVPIMGPLYTKIVISRFSRVFSMLLRNGIPVLRALEISPSTVPNTFLKDSVENIRQGIQNGGTVSDGFNQVPIFPPMVASLIAIGEKTGTLDDMLELVITQYDTDIRYTLRNLTTMIEPVITAVIAVAVLFLALAVFLPIWNMSQVLK